jgi:hypothetical protein
MIFTEIFSSNGRGSSLLPNGVGASSRYREINLAIVPIMDQNCKKNKL